MTPLNGPAQPRPKTVSLARGERRYRRKVASAKQWQRIIAAKLGPCRACTAPTANGHDFGRIEFHHLVARSQGGDDIEANIVPLHAVCHGNVTARRGLAAGNLLASLTDEEYAYCVGKGGEGFFERAYGLEYRRA